MSGVSVREQILQLIVSRLGAEGTPAKNVFRSRMEQISQADLPCYVVMPLDEDSHVGGDFTDRESVTRMLQVSVKAIVDAATQETGDSPELSGVAIDDSALDPFYVFAATQLVGGDGRLGGFVNAADESRHEMVFQPEGRDLIGLDMGFQFEFSTLRGDPTQRG